MLVVPGLLIAAGGAALLTRLTPGASYATHVLPTELLLGLGLGLAMVPCVSTATSHAEPRDVGVTSAATNTSQQIGASVGTALLNTLAATAAASYLVAHPGGAGAVAAGNRARLRLGRGSGRPDPWPWGPWWAAAHRRPPGPRGPAGRGRGRRA